jgi:hypothetical protein
LAKQPFLSHNLPADCIRFHIYGFRNNNFITEQGHQPCIQSPTWMTRSLYLCPPVTGWSSYIPGTRLSFCHLLQLARIQWRYSNPSPHGVKQDNNFVKLNCNILLYVYFILMISGGKVLLLPSICLLWNYDSSTIMTSIHAHYILQ